MLRSILLQQKEERNNLLKKDYLKRYSMNDIELYLHSGLIKLITGPRRVGKSVFALQMLSDQNFAYLNFDDELLLKYFEEDQLWQTLLEVYPNFNFLLLDEIQNLGYHVHVWNVIPNAGDFESEEFPAIGIMDERFNIVVEFNEKLRKYCENTNKVFLSIMDNLVANNYYKVNPEYYMDNIHLSEKAIALLNVNNAKGFDFTLK